VAKFPPEEQKEWLQQAVKNKWSIRELKKATDKTQKNCVLCKNYAFFEVSF